MTPKEEHVPNISGLMFIWAYRDWQAIEDPHKCRNPLLTETICNLYFLWKISPCSCLVSWVAEGWGPGYLHCRPSGRPNMLSLAGTEASTCRQGVVGTTCCGLMWGAGTVAQLLTWSVGCPFNLYVRKSVFFKEYINYTLRQAPCTGVVG